MDFIGIYENAMPSAFCKRIIDRHTELSEFCSGHRGEDAVNANGVRSRKDVSFFLERDDMELAAEINRFLDDALQPYMEEHPGLKMQQFYSDVVKVQKTPPKGGFHVWHCEVGATTASRSRCLVWMVYLNDCPEGEGTTEFIEQGVRIQPKEGTVVFFPADWTHTHRGNPVYNCDKYIITGWYHLIGD